MRSTMRLVGVSKRTVTRTMIWAGEACQKKHDEMVKSLTCNKIQADEIWCFVGCREDRIPKEERGNGERGDTWLWTAMDSDTKLMISYHVGLRDYSACDVFLDDLRSRVVNRPQVTTDGHGPYYEGVRKAFQGDVDFAMCSKTYGRDASHEARYRPPRCTGVKKRVICGSPDYTTASTSHVERSNLSIRMGCRRYTRLTNAFSKKMENHEHAVALQMFWYNFGRIHQTLRVTPAMEAKLTDHVWSLEDMASLFS